MLKGGRELEGLTGELKGGIEGLRQNYFVFSERQSLRISPFYGITNLQHQCQDVTTLKKWKVKAFLMIRPLQRSLQPS